MLGLQFKRCSYLLYAYDTGLVYSACCTGDHRTMHGHRWSEGCFMPYMSTVLRSCFAPWVSRERVRLLEDAAPAAWHPPVSLQPGPCCASAARCTDVNGAERPVARPPQPVPEDPSREEASRNTQPPSDGSHAAGTAAAARPPQPGSAPMSSWRPQAAHAAAVSSPRPAEVCVSCCRL